MKRKAPKQPKQSKRGVELKDLKPKKEAAGGRTDGTDSFYGTGVYKSTDSGRTW